jgi:Spy/CpxP family protein refolding chaperone
MRNPSRILLAVAVVCLIAAPARAQRGGFGGGGGPFILMAPNVQKALNLTDDQTGKVQQTVQDIFGSHRDEMMGLRDLPQDERAKKMREISKTMNDEAKKALSLTADQSKRFDQIILQARGLDALADPEIQGKLSLTDEQKSKINSITTDSREKMRDLFQNAGDDRQAAMQKMAELRKESMNQALAALTDDQKKTWKDITGEPVEINMPRPPGN